MMRNVEPKRVVCVLCFNGKETRLKGYINSLRSVFEGPNYELFDVIPYVWADGPGSKEESGKDREATRKFVSICEGIKKTMEHRVKVVTEHKIEVFKKVVFFLPGPVHSNVFSSSDVERAIKLLEDYVDILGVIAQPNTVNDAGKISTEGSLSAKEMRELSAKWKLKLPMLKAKSYRDFLKWVVTYLTAVWSARNLPKGTTFKTPGVNDWIEK